MDIYAVDVSPKFVILSFDSIVSHMSNTTSVEGFTAKNSALGSIAVYGSGFRVVQLSVAVCSACWGLTGTDWAIIESAPAPPIKMSYEEYQLSPASFLTTRDCYVHFSQQEKMENGSPFSSFIVVRQESALGCVLWRHGKNENTFVIGRANL